MLPDSPAYYDKTRRDNHLMLLRISFLVAVVATLAVARGKFEIDQPADRPWKVGERACVTIDQQSVCGKVIEVNETTAVVRKEVQGKGVTFVTPPTPTPSLSRAEPETPSQVRPKRSPKKQIDPRNFRWIPLPSAAPEPTPMPVVAPTPAPTPFPTPAPTAAPDPVESPLPAPWGRPPAPDPTVTAPVSPARREKSAPIKTTPTPETRQTVVAGPNLALGTNYFFPGLGVVIALGKTMSVGGNFFYAKSNVAGTELTAIGGFLTLSYFIRGVAPFGWFLTGGGGNYSLTGKTSTRQDKLNSPAVLGLVGWRGASRMGLGGGIGAGLQYALGAKSDAIKFHGPLPLALIEITFAF